MLLPVGMTDPNLVADCRVERPCRGYEPRVTPVHLSAKKHLERPAGFEPASLRWQRRILPLNEGRKSGAMDGSRTHLVFIDSEVPLPLGHHRVDLAAGLEPASQVYESRALPGELSQNRKWIRETESNCRRLRTEQLLSH